MSKEKSSERLDELEEDVQNLHCSVDELLEEDQCLHSEDCHLNLRIWALEGIVSQLMETVVALGIDRGANGLEVCRTLSSQYAYKFVCTMPPFGDNHDADLAAAQLADVIKVQNMHFHFVAERLKSVKS